MEIASLLLGLVEMQIMVEVNGYLCGLSVFCCQHTASSLDSHFMLHFSLLFPSAEMTDDDKMLLLRTAMIAR